MTDQIYTLIAARGMSLAQTEYRGSDDYSFGSGSTSRRRMPIGTFTIKVASNALINVSASSADEALANAPIGVMWLVFDEAGNCCMGDELEGARAEHLLTRGSP